MSSPRTLTELFFGAMDRYGGRSVLLRHWSGGAWRVISAAELLDQVRALAAALRELGVAPGDRVGLLSENRPEWAVTDYACLTTRCADVPIYPTLPASQTAYILRDAGAVAVFVSTREQLDKLLAVRADLPALRHVIAFDPLDLPADVTAFHELLERGRAAASRYPNWREEALRVTPDDLATIIYTSGTTGEPKGVMLSHGNIASNVAATCQVFDVRESDECLSLLPLSHIFERMAGHYVMLHAGVVISYARSVETVAQDMLAVRPTLMLAVPRLYEKFYARALEAASRSPITLRLFRWAKRVGERYADLRLAHAPVPLGLSLQQRVADRLVFAKLRRATGGRLRYFVSGGAPLNPEIARFFFAAGLPVLEGYGLTETSPVISVNTLDRLRLGTVGRPIPGVEVRIAEDGEILTRGPHVMRGYYNRPDDTAQVLDADGWLHTGDIGHLDSDGYLVITDRKKDLIVTAGGKNIAPQPIENRLKTNPFIANAVMLGDRRKFPFVLLVPHFERLAEWARQQGLPDRDPAVLVTRPEVQAKMEMEARKHLRDLAQFEVPKKFIVLERDFSIERGELTPKLSVRRRVVEQHFADRIEQLFRGEP
jgi:long-chain acyl-CoA synthetase